jgi:hypothetical protein
MAFKIDKSTLKITTKCKKENSCLSKERKDLCRVEHCVEGEIHFIECLNKKPCDYQKSFGSSFYCSCPTRKELYNKYKI